MNRVRLESRVVHNVRGPRGGSDTGDVSCRRELDVGLRFEQQRSSAYPRTSFEAISRVSIELPPTTS